MEPESPRPRLDGPHVNEKALRSTKAGLAAVFLLSLTFATFGPWFNLALAYGLMIAAMPVALLGLWWADQAAHEAKRDPTRTNGIYAKSGTALSIATLLVATYFTGLFAFVLVFWPLVALGLLVLHAFHRASIPESGAGA